MIVNIVWCVHTWSDVVYHLHLVINQIYFVYRKMRKKDRFKPEYGQSFIFNLYIWIKKFIIRMILCDLLWDFSCKECIKFLMIFSQYILIPLPVILHVYIHTEVPFNKIRTCVPLYEASFWKKKIYRSNIRTEICLKIFLSFISLSFSYHDNKFVFMNCFTYYLKSFS